MTDVETVVCETAAEAAQEAARELAAAARAGAHVALSGGSTPAAAFELASRLAPDWSTAEVWWGDERSVPPDDPRSNYRLACEKLLDALARPPRAVHRIRGELPPEDAARRYDAELRGVRLGLALQGIGADGHTASLFPGSPALDEQERLAVAVQREDVARVTLTLPALRAAETVVFLAVGSEKAEAVHRAFAAAPSRETPASLVRSSGGRTRAILDREAASRLPS